MQQIKTGWLKGKELVGRSFCIRWLCGLLFSLSSELVCVGIYESLCRCRKRIKVRKKANLSVECNKKVTMSAELDDVIEMIERCL